MVYTDGYYLVADTDQELHQFAERVGLRRAWFRDHPHYPMYEAWGKPMKSALKEKDCILTDADDLRRRATLMVRVKPKLPTGVPDPCKAPEE